MTYPGSPGGGPPDGGDPAAGQPTPRPAAADRGFVVLAPTSPAAGSNPFGPNSRGASFPAGPSGPIALPRSTAPRLTGAIPLRIRKPRRAFAPDDATIIPGRGLTRLSSRPQPTTAAELQAATVRWMVTLWIMAVLLQRFSLPGQPIPLLLPLALVWAIYGMVRGVVDFDRHRFGWWLATAGISALAIPIQFAVVPDPLISPLSWGLLMTIWLVFLFRLRDRRRSTFLKVLHGVAWTCVWLSLLVTVMMVSQFALPYQDWMAKVIPANFLLQDYIITAPIAYGSPLYRGNGWIGLEPSIVSFQMGVGIVAGILLRWSLPKLGLMALGMICSVGASGFAIVGIAVFVIMASPLRWALARYSLLIPAGLAMLATPMGATLLGRATEGSSANSSTGLRATVPYQVLWPEWTSQFSWVAFGRGAGSSQDLVEQSGIVGLLVPTPIKLFFDYGVIIGLILAAFMLTVYWGGHSRAMGITIAFSLWVFQPGLTTFVLVIAVPMMVTWWTPRRGQMIEDDFVPSPHATIAPPVGGRPRVEVSP